MRFTTLADWLSWQESLNPKQIDLGLERVADVLQRLQLSSNFFCPVISIAGTNGKGSTLALAESILFRSGLSVGSYTSPHLFSYNERICINQQPVSDEELCEVFDIIDQARGDIPLTYFEFGTLAALLVFVRHQVDVVLLEVGLGGRLDAVNVIDADVAIITSIDIDHVDWLGSDRETIAVEKAGILREAKPAIIAFDQPPQSLLTIAQQLNTKLYRSGQQYSFQRLGKDHWQLQSELCAFDSLPCPALQGEFQLQNAAAAIMAIHALQEELADKFVQLTQQSIAQGLTEVRLIGRYQQISDVPLVIVDVAHNEQSAQMLAELLNSTSIKGKTLAVIAMLADKAITEVIQRVAPEIDMWITAGLDVYRGLPAKNMQQAVRERIADDKLAACHSVADACELAKTLATDADRIIVFGSFYTVAEATQFFSGRLTTPNTTRAENLSGLD